jgi:hypothetical protein
MKKRLELRSDDMFNEFSRKTNLCDGVGEDFYET